MCGKKFRNLYAQNMSLLPIMEKGIKTNSFAVILICSVYFVSSVGSKLKSDSPAGVFNVMWWSVHQPAAAS